MRTVSDSYVLGIKEGRQFLNNNPGMTKQEMQESLAACKRLAASHSHPMKDVFKGEADFWKNQIKKA